MSLAVDVSWWMLTVLVGASVLVAYAAYSRPVVALSGGQRASLTGLRLLALLLVLIFLLRPVTVDPGQTRRAVVPVLIDNSRSMRVADANDDRRIESALALARDEILPRLSDDFDVVVFSLDGAVVPTQLTAVRPNAPNSDLAGALRAITERYEGQSVAGIVVISDGGDTSNRDVASVVEHGVPPVYAFGVGATEPPLDLEVVNLTAGEATAVESVVDVGVVAVSHGRDQTSIELRLLEDGRLLQVRRLTLPGEGIPARTVLQVSPKTDAATLYTVEIPADVGELVVENNRRSVLVRPPGRPRRVLMIEGAPGYEHSFLKRAWLADPGITLDAVVRKGQNDRGEHTFYVQGDPDRTAALATGYPVDRAALFRYDAIVFANIESEFLRPDQLAMTAEFVAERGGGLLLFGSRSFINQGIGGSPLEDLLPLELSDRGRTVGGSDVDADPNRLLLTDDGAAHPIMQLAPTMSDTRDRWESVPSLAGSVSLGAPKPGASVLALVGRPEGGASPLIAIQRYGSGRSMVFAGEAAWRWKMMLPADSRLYESFWGQAARWLTGSAPEPVTVTADPDPSPGDRVHLDVRVRDAEHQPVTDATPVVQVTTPSGDVRTLTAVLTDGATGGYVAEFRADVRGVYRVEARAERDGSPLGSSTEWVLVGGADEEFASPWLNTHVLRRVAMATGGDFLVRDDLGGLPELLRTRASDQASPTTRDLWHGLWSFVLVVLVLTAEWSLRRAWGMK